MKNGYASAAPKRVAIVGLGPSHTSYIRDIDACGDRKQLFDETWTFNTFANAIESDRLFHMDDVLVQERRARNGNKRVANMLESLKRYKNPIYTCFPEPEYPSMVQYPLVQIANKYDSLYFTTTPPYAMAFAGLIGVEELMIYGCDYTWPGIAGAETGRACMEYWVGRLKSMGIKIGVDSFSSLCDARVSKRDDIRLYGYDRVHISLQEREGGMCLVMREKELPTAEEIEERYSHTQPGSGIQLDVVN